ncbi:MAG: hypothetical protein M3Z09_10145 [Acidobacteriota bacterium]|nr:hypothetical protein [Acidobacteriota bacterium]
MNFEPLEKIANAVLYEGFLLYPYRKSSVKNQQRWHFGTIGPVGGADRTMMQTECLVEGSGETVIDIKIRFLQGDIEREVVFRALHPATPPEHRPISFPPIEGAVEIESARVDDRVFRFTIRILNLTEACGENCSMLAAHTLLAVREGTFLSLLDPPEEYRAAAAACRNIATWPVLAGREGERSLMLSSPIILYDYPQIAPESAGNLFDSTEIDEILSLRVLTLSDEEKQEVRAGGDQARRILERTEALPPEAFAKMHGAIRGLRKASKLEFREGDRVRLHPSKKADIFDIALDGKIAIVESVERDFEDNVHLAVTIEDDPGREFGVMRQIGHRFFFGPEEVELV